MKQNWLLLPLPLISVTVAFSVINCCWKAYVSFIYFFTVFELRSVLIFLNCSLSHFFFSFCVSWVSYSGNPVGKKFSTQPYRSLGGFLSFFWSWGPFAFIGEKFCPLLSIHIVELLELSDQFAPSRSYWFAVFQFITERWWIFPNHICGYPLPNTVQTSEGTQVKWARKSNLYHAPVLECESLTNRRHGNWTGNMGCGRWTGRNLADYAVNPIWDPLSFLWCYAIRR